MNARSPAWWEPPGALARFVADLIAGELARLRPGRAVRPPPWPDGLLLEADLGADSLERLHLATALGEAIQLQRSGIDDGLLGQATLADWIATARRSLQVYDAELTFKTSGSLGQPKWCVHSLTELRAEVELHAAQLAGAGRIVSAVPCHHIYGFLFTLLLPVRLGVDVVDVRAHAPARLATLLRPGDVVVAHPEFWGAFVRSVLRVEAGAVGVSSTAPCSPEVARAVTAAGVTRLIEIYGSSETAGIGWRDDPAAPFELLASWQRGVTESELVRVDGGQSRIVRVPDRLQWIDARRLRPAGRAEGAVQVGGTNVFPEQIAAALRARPGVADAAVRLMRPDEGTRLKAFIVPAVDADRGPDLGALQAALWGWIDAHLSVPERPRSIVFGDRLPTGALGKRADWPLPDDFA